ncbi:MAG TPA: TetR/AcrR family transcriptional regulator [Polyangiaceae bacterium LLY-WYZ-15_(1-7)]|nr:hypothetical protein [Sandaracinus sp.]MBJ70257.1 hypothetical protein [Sandaracinus sp.]HJL00401.1 TetR/AcrR family transcriptional regulator [Polyangiaceae bacterium LLY-WYZ-15_(1-7)]HJL11016.1 TetR/AcrR family transcriptional regulator [Polyangiaceae bacterium LLY-WYZ-15_(1-7)]HJL39239.1 TetR/AcrR family transcriptional regulator [Polyangiaceae bacterium LLY-WYZ-15_(1-7)]
METDRAAKPVASSSSRPPRGRDKRRALVSAARDALYELGLKKTTLAEVARRAEVPLGNVYYYYKSKGALIGAVIEARRGELEAELEACAGAGAPREQLCAFLTAQARGAETKARLGCPLATLAQDLRKGEHPRAGEARALLELQLGWLEARFRREDDEERRSGRARELAEQLLAAVHGAFVLAHALDDPSVVRRRMGALEGWVVART